MNRKLFRVITVVLAVLIVGQLLNLALQIHSDVYHYSYDEDTFLYTIQDGRYSELPDKKRRNEMEHVKADAQLQECYAVADYYEAAYVPAEWRCGKEPESTGRYENCTVRHG